MNKQLRHHFCHKASFTSSIKQDYPASAFSASCPGLQVSGTEASLTITKWQGAHPCRDQMERQRSLLHHPPAFPCSNMFWSSNEDFLFIFSEQAYKCDGIPLKTNKTNLVSPFRKTFLLGKQVLLLERASLLSLQCQRCIQGKLNIQDVCDKCWF